MGESLRLHAQEDEVFQSNFPLAIFGLCYQLFGNAVVHYRCIQERFHIQTEEQ